MVGWGEREGGWRGEVVVGERRGGEEKEGGGQTS